MLAIYSNNFSTDYYISKLNFYQPYQIYHSVEQYLASTNKIKIAFVNHLNSITPNLANINARDTFSQEINKLKNASTMLIAFDNELHPYHCKMFSQHQQPNVYWAIPGHVNDKQLVDPTNIILWNGHFIQFLTEYGPVSNKLNELNYNKVKNLYFDALLGTRRAHRDFVYEKIQKENLQNKILTTYMNSTSPVSSFHVMFKTNLEWEPDIENFDKNVTLSTDYVHYQGHRMSLSRIVPIQIYNRTCYSIVAETGLDNRYSFFTEKTAKPMMARRLFVMFSGYKFLNNLRNLGFKTFGNVIDESYDSIYNDQDRWSAAFEQVQRLCEMDQQEVFAKIAETTEHNYSVLINTDWQQHLLNQLQQKLTQHLAITHV